MKTRPVTCRTLDRAGFTLLELLAAIAILAVMTTLLFAAFGQASRSWQLTENRVQSFSQARAALDYMAKELSQAVVTPNITFLGDANDVAFVAPVNTGTNAVDLVEVVYRLSLPAFRPGRADPAGIFVDGANVWPKRLARRATHFGADTTEGWDYGGGAPCLSAPWDFYGLPNPNPNWPETSAQNRTAVLADNIIGLSFTYIDPNGVPSAFWNSSPILSWTRELGVPIPAGSIGPAPTPIMINRSPAAIQITIFMIDAKAAVRLKGLALGTPAYKNIVNESQKSFGMYVAIPNRQP